MDLDLKYCNALNLIPGLGSRTLSKIMSSFESAEIAWSAPTSAFVDIGLPESSATKITEQRTLINPEAEWEKLEKEQIVTIPLNDARYPILLKQIPDPPYLIYTKGNLDCLNLPLVAIVGSRKLTSYGSQAATAFARDLARNGVCVVSGLAFGIDAAAHGGALAAKGKTIAVLGSSLDSDSIYPRSNYNLAEDILESGGLLMSEFPLVTPPSQWTFPTRNRIIAGISSGTLVVEAAQKSGSLITTSLALDFNREVFAVPGPIFSEQSQGTNSLIRSSGAKLVLCAQDILEELHLAKNPKETKIEAKIKLTGNEEKVYKTLSHESLHIDRIGKLAKLETASISSILAILEIKGLIKNVGGQNYIKI